MRKNAEAGNRMDGQSLEEIKRYLCPKNAKKDPAFCMECKSIKACATGQRAVVLMDREAVDKAGGTAEGSQEESIAAEVLRRKYLEQAQEEERLRETRKALEKDIERIDRQLEAVKGIKDAIEITRRMIDPRSEADIA